ncbi:hypothetical protein H4V97_000272 [Flavobacterium sp. CG_23.5]|uniref:hypothetical protein n=1 Tax=Flavobacterium sp. CG_23.5 TaxID=2760708 RepID=UPI001AE9EF24|nr:hypothetical protein [Flavobacterium sp. CG_23.5]MBP2281954.1 hypothetical protein [Flavobacterium sp. CG_23.5]
MGKRLPYFQFEVAEYLAGDIMFCSFEAQGLFVNIMALYWQKDCELQLEQAMKRLKSNHLFEELIKENIIKINSGKITINFLDEQYSKASDKSRVNSMNGSLGGRPKKQTESENKPNGYDSVSKSKSEKKPIREDKIIEDEIKESIPNKVVDLKNQPTHTRIDFNKLVSFFNDNRGILPEVKKLSDARKKRIQVLEKQYGKECIQIAIEKVRDSNFLQGNNKDNWTATFDWIFNPTNFIKIIEDNYLNKDNSLRSGGNLQNSANDAVNEMFGVSKPVKSQFVYNRENALKALNNKKQYVFDADRIINNQTFNTE